MSHTDPAFTREDYPVFDLEWRYDEPDSPREVTVFSTAEHDDVTTTWITIDVDHAISLDTVP